MSLSQLLQGFRAWRSLEIHALLPTLSRGHMSWQRNDIRFGYCLNLMAYSCFVGLVLYSLFQQMWLENMRLRLEIASSTLMQKGS